jgi:dTDP-4-amino-4,6-dideoxygalactose transaminase
VDIPLFDLRPQNTSVRTEIDAGIARVLDSGQFILGREVEAFEGACASVLENHHTVGVSSGTCALITSLLVLGVGPGDEVVVPAFTYAATATAVRWVGARPVLADVDPATANLSPEALGDAVSGKTKAVIPVHLFGHPADMKAMTGIGAAVVEDAAQSFGAQSAGRQTGCLGTLGCHSFYPTKPLGGFGDGGLVVTADGELAKALRVVRGQGDVGGYRFERVGGNFRLDALQAAALQAKLPHVETWRQERERGARWYLEAFSASELGDAIQPPPLPREGDTHAWALFVIRARDRDALATHLRARGIGCGVYYPIPLHLQPAFGDLGYKSGDFPEAERASREVLALPMFAGITQSQVGAVVEGLTGFYKG